MIQSLFSVTLWPRNGGANQRLPPIVFVLQISIFSVSQRRIATTCGATPLINSVDIPLAQPDITGMNNVYDCDAIVVGGGLAGAATALGLAHAGLSVIALDADAATTDRAAAFDGRAYAVALGSQRFWNAVGVWKTVAEHAEPKVSTVT
jgi:hypothetical protein